MAVTPLAEANKTHPFQAIALNERLNTSEQRLRGRIGHAKVDTLIREFKAAAERNRKLFSTLYEHNDPYRWLWDVWARKPRRQPPAYPTQPRQ